MIARSLFTALLTAALTACSMPGNSLPVPPGPTEATTASPAPPAASLTPAPAQPAYQGRVSGVGAARLAHSWRPGCPVPIEDLRLLSLHHWGFDGKVRSGEMVVHADQAAAIVEVFRRLFELEFPIEKMELVGAYAADDDRSMAANNTSAFNCREIAGRPGSWSEHAFGRAIDINPVQNPYLPSAGGVLPPAGSQFADRSREHPGLITADGPVVEAFAAIGWGWGGHWARSKDYQHFSSTGR